MSEEISKWPGPEITVSYLPDGALTDQGPSNLFARMSAHVPLAQWQGVFTRALAIWSAAANLTFRMVPADGNIRLGGGVMPTDTYGFTYGPPSGLCLLATGPDYYPGGMPFFLTNVLHELGHALGLSHSANFSAIMYPEPPLRGTLAPADVAAIRKLYGAPLLSPPPPPTHKDQGMISSFRGSFRVRCHNPDGQLAWEATILNAPTLAGLDYVMGAAFAGASPLTSWYAGLIDSASFTALSTADTLASHAGWAEATQYSEGARRPWANLARNNGVASNNSPMTFTLTAAKTIKGLFLASDATKGGTTGTLWATAPFTLPKALSVGQVLSVTYINRLAGGT